MLPSSHPCSPCAKTRAKVQASGGFKGIRLVLKFGARSLASFSGKGVLRKACSVAMSLDLSNPKGLKGISRRKSMKQRAAPEFIET